MSKLTVTTEREQRTFQVKELRAVPGENGAPSKVVGYASVFGVWSEDLGGWRERIEPGAFTNALKASDVRALINHDPSLIIGRTKSGTLSLRQDDTGLWMEATLPDTQYARDLLVSVQRGDIDQMSFGFTVLRDELVWTDSEIRRMVFEVSELFDVSPVTFPAYPQTSASVRSRLTEFQSNRNGKPDGQAAVDERELERQAAQELMQMRVRIAEVEI